MLPYQEGSAFCVTLPQGGYALGIVARMAPKGKILFGYFFGQRSDVPQFDLRSVRADDAILVGMFGDLHLWKRKWEVIGLMPDWDRIQWPLPLFSKRDPLGHLPDQVVVYDEDNIGQLGRWERRDVIPDGIPSDGFMGAGSVELKLEMLLA